MSIEQDIFPEVTLSTVYKYRPLTTFEEVHRLVVSGELWFSCARTFNDPFDTALTYGYGGAETPLAERWAVSAANRHMPNETKEARALFVAQRLRSLRTDPGDLQAQRATHIQMTYDRFGICSLAANRDNLLMWAHYADSHKGICIGLDVNAVRQKAIALLRSNEVLEFLPVVYSEQMPRINFFEAMLDQDNTENIMTFVRVKSTHWQYEQEHRIVIHGHTNMAIKFGQTLVKEIIFGCKVPEAQRTELVATCKAHAPHARLFDAVTDDRFFRLNIVPI